jgi:uncharacterized protein (DUF2267 family)
MDDLIIQIAASATLLASRTAVTILLVVALVAFRLLWIGSGWNSFAAYLPKSLQQWLHGEPRNSSRKAP